MANELLYVPGIGTRFYYDATKAGSITLTEVGSGSFTSALENGRGAIAFNGKALKFDISYGMQNSRTIEYWMTLTGWNNTGTSHQWGYMTSHNTSFVKWLPKPASGTNNFNMQLDFGDGDPEDTTVSLSSQTDPIHVAQVFDTSDSNYQLKMYINGTKVKEHYYHNPYTTTVVIGGSVSAYNSSSLTDAFTGKISDFLVTDGAKYTSNFTPARPTLDLSGFSKGGNPLENFTAPEINYLEIGGVPYKIAVAS